MPGKIQVYTGAGKGKTTAALGLLLRFLGSGGRACLIQFDKGGEGLYHERKILRALPNLNLHATGLKRFDEASQSFRFENLPGDFEEAALGLRLAAEALGKGYGLLVLDEILSLPLTHLADQDQIMKFLAAYELAGRPCELVLTGHKLWPELKEKADLVTEMRKVKHYFDQDLKARKGIEY